MIGITELLIVIGVFALVGLHLTVVGYLIHRQEQPDATQQSAQNVGEVAAPDRSAAVNIGHNDAFAHAR